MAKKKRKIIFIRNWGTYKIGDVMKDPTDVTIRELCYKHKFGRLEGDPSFEARIRREKLTMEKLAQDISFGVKEAEKDVSGIVDQLDRELATPTPPASRKRTRSPAGQRKRKKK